MPKRAADTVLEGLQKRCCEIQARIDGQKEDIARKKVENEIAAKKAAEEAARIEEERQKAELAQKIEQAAKDKVAKLEQEERNNRAFLLDIDIDFYDGEKLSYDLINPVLDGKLPVNGTSKKDLLTEVLKANVDERIKIKTKVSSLITDKWENRDFIKKQQMYSISIKVKETKLVYYRVIYDGVRKNNRKKKNEFIYFDISCRGYAPYTIEKGCYMKKYAEDEKEGWYNFYLNTLNPSFPGNSLRLVLTRLHEVTYCWKASTIEFELDMLRQTLRWLASLSLVNKQWRTEMKHELLKIFFRIAYSSNRSVGLNRYFVSTFIYTHALRRGIGPLIDFVDVYGKLNLPAADFAKIASMTILPEKEEERLMFLSLTDIYNLFNRIVDCDSAVTHKVLVQYATSEECIWMPGCNLWALMLACVYPIVPLQTLDNFHTSMKRAVFANNEHEAWTQQVQIVKFASKLLQEEAPQITLALNDTSTSKATQ